MARWLMRLFIVLLLLAMAGGAAFYSYVLYDTSGPLAAEKTVVLPRGEGFQKIADTLEREGVISSALAFKAAALVTGQASHFKAGEYAFPPGVTPRETMAQIAEGRVVIHKLTIPEGLAVYEIIPLLANEPSLTGDIPTPIPEGSLLPETYHFLLGDTRESVIRRMQKAMKDTLASAWAARQQELPLATPEQALVLASIVEKETGVEGERPHVASVFINRLNKGMKLQSDPTVAYGIEARQRAPLGRPLTQVDLLAASPYNTYIIDGLPPTPIANPGKAAIFATLNPLATNDLYFVATGNGGHRFAATLEAHNANVKAYRAALKAQQP